ncbi:branched-chain-amino-acid transaminase bat2 [Marasmius crinis-equi]|uniref:Branched-chain-amino-acid aminotransferase n=1 Tax=Marasmius crinis-equi TaxID=585013 RepID=A0ABR3FM99_9AGAR
MWKSVGNGFLEGVSKVADIDPEKLVVNTAETLKPVPAPESLIFGVTKTDHMLVVSFDPENGWSSPEIKPYGPIDLDPCASCLQYATNIFEGMKAYLGPDGEPLLFRPEINMTRMERSAERVALPPFNSQALLALIKKLVVLERRWIPKELGHSLYIRPTMIGTRPCASEFCVDKASANSSLNIAFGVAASDQALLYVVCSPAGPFFRGPSKEISLLATNETVRAWPGGHGGHKLAVNYGPGFSALREATNQGYNQVLWLLGDKITEAGAMNFFAVVKRDDGDLDLITPPLDGTILPGVTRQSILDLANAHTEGTSPLPNIPPSQKLYTHEQDLTMTYLRGWHAEGKLLETFCVGTAVIVGSVTRIGQDGKDLVIDASNSVTEAFRERLEAIQTGNFKYESWSAPCQS